MKVVIYKRFTYGYYKRKTIGELLAESCKKAVIAMDKLRITFLKLQDNE